MRNDHAPPSPAHAPPPRWVRAADILTILLILAALQAVVFGGFELPGLSIRNPWRPLLLALIVGGARLYQFGTASIRQELQRFCRWVEQGDDHEDDAPRRPGMDALFIRTFDLLAVWIASVSFASVALLALGAYDATVAVISGTLVGTVLWFFTPARFDTGNPAPGRPILPILLLVLLTALLFRAGPFRTIHGGQDQGLYVAMSSYLQREGSVFMEDPLPEALPDRRSREIYEAGLLSQPPIGALIQPGIYPHAGDDGDYVFQFYHLHALWMAAFAEMFGDGARFHALTFFGLLSVLGLSLLSFELTGSRLAVAAVGLLLAVNPLHAYFSRFPVTEVVALGFSSVGFYHLARAFRAMRDAAPAAVSNSLLALAAASVSLVFFVRITGFLYLPALVPLFGVGVWWTLEGRRSDGRRIVRFCAAVAALYGVSVLYGLEYSPPYALSVYDSTFGRLLGAHWPLVTAGTAVAAVAAMAAVARNPHRPGLRRLLTWAARPQPWVWLGTAAAAATIVGSLYQAYLLGFTDRYAQDEFLARFDVVGAGSVIFLQSGIAAWLLYASPLLVVVLVWGMHRRERSAAEAMLYVFLTVCLAANVVFHVPVIYLHYYYARYLLSETVPYSIVLAVTLTALAAPGSAFRRLGVVAILAAMPLHLYFTARQMPVRQGLQPYAVLSRIADRVGEGILLLDVNGFGGGRLHTRLQTPLSLYFGTRVFPYATEDLDTILQSFEGLLGANVWLLTTGINEHPEMRLSETFPYRDRRMEYARTIPTVDRRYWDQMVFLYRQREICAAPDCELGLRDRILYSLGYTHVYHRRMLGAGWHGAEERHAWSGPRATLTLSRHWFPSGTWPAAMLLETRAFAASPDHLVTVTARSGGVAPVIAFDHGETEVRQVPLACASRLETCTVVLEIEGARSPLEVLGLEDGRTLGIALYRIGFRF